MKVFYLSTCIQHKEGKMGYVHTISPLQLIVSAENHFCTC